MIDTKRSFESEPFISSDITEKYSNIVREVPYIEHTNSQSSKTSHGKHKKLFCFHFIFLVVNLSLFLATLSFSQTRDNPKAPVEVQPIDPDQQTKIFNRTAFRYKETRFIDRERSPYTGPRTETLDAAWQLLLEEASIRISDEELAGLNETSVPLPESWGWLAWTEASHQVHCVQFLRIMLYRDQYVDDVGTGEGETKDHIEHCLNHLLQNALCHGGTSLKLFGWEADKRKPIIKSNYNHPRMCMDLEHFRGQNRERVIGHAEMRRLRNPLL